MIDYRITEQNVIVTDDDLNTFTIPLSEDRGKEVARLAVLRDARTDAETERMLTLADPAKATADVFSGLGVDVSRFGVATIDGKVVDGTAGKRLATAKRYGDVARVSEYAQFVRRCHANPIPSAITDLLDWLENSDLGILPDGRFLAFKVVTDDFKDCRTQTMDNSVGQTVVMPGGRAEVDPDNTNVCSTGLHFCSKGNLSSFSYDAANRRVVLLAVDPADVVAIPVDYGRAKGRAVQYEVIDVIDTSEDAKAKEFGLVNYHPAVVVPEQVEDDGEEWDADLTPFVGAVATDEDAPVVDPAFFVEGSDATEANASPWAKGFRGKLARLINGGK